MPGRVRAPRRAAFFAIVSASLVAAFAVSTLIVMPSPVTTMPMSAPAASTTGPVATAARGWAEEPVEPGVHRVLDVDARLVTVAPEGSVWVDSRPGPDDPSSTFHQLGATSPRGTASRGIVFPPSPLAVDAGPADLLWVFSGRGVLFRWDGEEWHRDDCCFETSRAFLAQDDGSVLAVSLQPDVRAMASVEGAGLEIQGYVDGAWIEGEHEPLILRAPPAALARRSQGWLSFASGGDGVAWAAFPFGADPNGAQLWRWEQGVWQAQDPPGLGGDVRAVDIAVGRDGTVWVYLADPRSGDPRRGSQERRLARFQDGEWTVWNEQDGVPWVSFEPPMRMAVGPSGEVWVPTVHEDRCGGLTRFDGIDWRHRLSDWCITSTGVGPDGTAWATGVDDRTGDRALFRVDPDQADVGANGNRP